MKSYWEGTVKHLITDENGKLKKVNKVYLVEAVNHTEVEAILTKKMSEIVQGDFTIKPIRQSDVSRVISCSPGESFYKVKVEYDFEKKETEVILVEAVDLQSALTGFFANETILGYDFEVISVSKSKVLDVYEGENLFQIKFEGTVSVAERDDVDFPQEPAEFGFDDRPIYDPEEDENLIQTFDDPETYSVTNTDDDLKSEFNPRKILEQRDLGDVKDVSEFIAFEDPSTLSLTNTDADREVEAP